MLGLIVRFCICFSLITALQTGSVIIANASSPTINFQGRLLDPVTGSMKADGIYTMLFGIYTTETGGAPVWTEKKDVKVANGLFNSILGNTTPFQGSLFNGQLLWVGVTVGSDPQMTPRQQLTYVPYAAYSNNADTLDGVDSNNFSSSSHTHPTLPLACGYISQYDPLLRNGSYNVDSAVWNDSLSRFEITLTGHYFSITDIAVATLIGDTGLCPAGATIRTTSVNGKLIVYIVNSAGSKIKCSFHFISYHGQ